VQFFKDSHREPGPGIELKITIFLFSFENAASISSKKNSRSTKLATHFGKLLAGITKLLDGKFFKFSPELLEF